MRNLVLSNDDLKFKITPTYKNLNLPPLYRLNSKLKTTHPLYSFSYFREQLSNFDYSNGIFFQMFFHIKTFYLIQKFIF
jgi:hypothetical protein